MLPLGGNPFAPLNTTASLSNPFQAAKPPPPTINQLRAQNQFSGPFETNSSVNHSTQPVIPSIQTNNNIINPPVLATFNNFPQQQTQTHNPFAM